jgi:hypothetical protein
VSNYPTSEIVAKNESAFGGGTSREVSAVSEDDMVNLEKDLSESLVGQAKSDILSDNSETLAVDTPVNLTVLTKNFSGKVGDEVGNLTLKYKVGVDFLVFDKADTLTFAQKLLASKVDEKYLLRDDNVAITLADATSVNDGFQVNFLAEGTLLPKVAEKELADKISGRRMSIVTGYLKSLPSLANASVSLSPFYSRFLGILPIFPSKITLIVDAY